MANEQIKLTAKGKGVALWQVADRLGISEPTMTRKLRKEIDGAEKERILSIIDDIASKKGAE